MKNITIETTRVTMKSPVGMIDTSDILNAINNRETLEYLSEVPFDYTEDNAISFLTFLTKTEESEMMLQLGIFEKENNEFIGMMSLESINYNSKSCEIGYWFAKKYTGKGIALEAARNIVEFAFDSLKLNTINAYVIKEHIKSISLLERLGFIQKELLINNEENKGVLVDRYLYVISKKR